MPQITVSQFKRALAARKKLAAGPVAGESSGVQVEKRQETLRLAAESRYEAAKFVGGGLFRNVVLLDKPFLIWAHPSNILWDSSTEPRNSWAKIHVEDDGLHPGVDFLDRLTFWYVWENDTAYTTVVDVSAYTTVSGSWQAEASIYAIHDPIGHPGDPDYDPTNTDSAGGSAHLALSANLALYEWWNSPPTLAPLQNAPDQQTQISFLNLDLQAVPPDPVFKSSFMFNGFELKQRLLVIPPEGVLVAEVNFDVGHKAHAGHVSADFFNGEGNQVTSHWLQVEYVLAPPLIATPVGLLEV